MTTWMRAAAWTAVALLAPAVASACPSCVNTQEQNRTAYLVTTALMTLMPLGMVGGLVVFLRRAAKSARANEFAATTTRSLPSQARPPGP